MNTIEGVSVLIDMISAKLKPLLVIIAGGSCSGKTYFTELLCRTCNMRSIANSSVPLDLFFKDGNDSTLPKINSRKDFDQLESYRLHEYWKCLENLLRGKKTHSPTYDKVRNKVVSDFGEVVISSPVIITEGLFAITLLRGHFKHAEKIMVYIEANTEIRLERRIERDKELFGVSENIIKERFFYKVHPSHIKNVEPQKNFADLIINTKT